MNVEVLRCKDCGEWEVVIPKVEELHRVIAHIVACGKSRLRGCEIKFLRKYLGYSGSDAAKALAVGSAWLSRCENDKVHIAPGTERFLRLMVLYDQPKQSYPLDELLAAKSDHKPSPIKLDLGKSWQPAR